MVWVVGSIGFVLGFLMGQVIMISALKDKSDEELKFNKSLQRKWGLFNWALAIIWAWGAVYIFNHRINEALFSRA